MSLNTIVPASRRKAVRKPKTASIGLGKLPSPIVSATNTANPIIRQFGILMSVKNGASRADDWELGRFNLPLSVGFVDSTNALFQNKPK
jgi:hypothetical protein